MKHYLAVMAALVLSTSLNAWAATGIGASRSSSAQRLSVMDSIDMTRIVNSDPTYSSAHAKSPFSFSPSGEHVSVVVRKGDLRTGSNVYSLWLFSVRDIQEFVNSKKSRSRPIPRVLARFSIPPQYDRSDRDAIDQVAWTGNSAYIGFIGRAAFGRGQVYLCDILTGELRQLTTSAADVLSFDISPELDQVVYSADAVVDWSERNMKGYAVQSRHGDNAFTVSRIDPQEIRRTNIRYFIVDVESGKERQVDGISSYLLPRPILISPNGRSAVTLAVSRNLPRHWLRYQFLAAHPALVDQDGVGGAAEDGARNDSIELEEAFANPNARWAQYQIIDLATGSVRPLIDAPTVGASFGRAEAAWSPDSRKVLLPPTFLPLDAPDMVERDVRRTREATAVVDVVSGVSGFVEPHRHDGSQPAVPVALRWASNKEVRVDTLFKVEGKWVEQRTGYKLNEGEWLRAGVSTGNEVSPSSEGGVSVILRVVQDLNTPPEISARDTQSGRERVLTDLNPQLRERDFGRVVAYKWKTPRGVEYEGGLVLPPAFTTKQRYPIVLQSNGFYRNVFLLDGAADHLSPHAARALAARDVLVLQMPDPTGRPNSEQIGGYSKDAIAGEERETTLFVEQMESAIDALDAAALIDRKRVGLMGFSRQGMKVQHALAFSRYPIAAATIADSIALTPSNYALLYGQPYPGMAEFELDRYPGFPIRMAIGAPLWGAGVEQWVERSYLFHLDRVHTPTRYEYYGPLVGNWEVFAILKRMKRPVEMFHIPLATHNLKAPFAVYASKQGNVDWFCFWLRREEDSDPEKSTQWSRWRDLRLLQLRSEDIERSQATLAQPR